MHGSALTKNEMAQQLIQQKPDIPKSRAEKIIGTVAAQKKLEGVRRWVLLEETLKRSAFVAEIAKGAWKANNKILPQGSSHDGGGASGGFSSGAHDGGRKRVSSGEWEGAPRKTTRMSDESGTAMGRSSSAEGRGDGVSTQPMADYFQIIDSGADDSYKTHVLSALLANEKQELVEQCFYENHWDGRQFTGRPDWKALREALTKRTQQ